ncbi:unnamed protein product [Ceutorhynchus assimilis]|uniref:Uncharacterized protein n=1 Tax=Ceutorhynchus assimilis TaxID=467358 RepID=A0A9N9QEQ7_9CUCU|nr:unnamed protein product [Ceutorhynchus assimilis]
MEDIEPTTFRRRRTSSVSSDKKCFDKNNGNNEKSKLLRRSLQLVTVMEKPESNTSRRLRRSISMDELNHGLSDQCFTEIQPKQTSSRSRRHSYSVDVHTSTSAKILEANSSRRYHTRLFSMDQSNHTLAEVQARKQCTKVGSNTIKNVDEFETKVIESKPSSRCSSFVTVKEVKPKTDKFRRRSSSNLLSQTLTSENLDQQSIIQMEQLDSHASRTRRRHSISLDNLHHDVTYENIPNLDVSFAIDEDQKATKTHRRRWSNRFTESFAIVDSATSFAEICKQIRTLPNELPEKEIIKLYTDKTVPKTRRMLETISEDKPKMTLRKFKRFFNFNESNNSEKYKKRQKKIIKYNLWQNPHQVTHAQFQAKMLELGVRF